jgi:hypothetical protein
LRSSDRRQRLAAVEELGAPGLRFGVAPRGSSRLGAVPRIVWIGIVVIVVGAVVLLRPLVAWWRQAEDPTVAAVVWAIGLAGIVVGITAAEVHDRAVADYGLKGLGGVLLLLTAYFTARNLRQAARTSFLERFMRASELLAEEDPVKRHAGLETLLRLHDHARDAADKGAVVAVVQEFVDTTDMPANEDRCVKALEFLNASQSSKPAGKA